MILQNLKKMFIIIILKYVYLQCGNQDFLLHDKNFWIYSLYYQQILTEKFYLLIIAF